MYCKACEMLTELELKEHSSVKTAHANLEDRIVTVSGNFSGMSRAQVADELTKTLLPHGYSLSLQPEQQGVRWGDFWIAAPAAIGFIAFFVLLQKAGVVNLVRVETISFGTALLIGFIASLSTCMAVVGGLVLSISASFAKSGDRVWPQVTFHVGRLIAFFILGGLIGAVGSMFQLSATGMFALTFLVGMVMLILGISLLDVFSNVRGILPSIPRALSTRAIELSRANRVLSPFLLGAATFVLPCGFTQAMQFYALSTGGFWAGALTMSMFALGTLPVLALLSFGALGFRGMAKSSLFF